MRMLQMNQDFVCADETKRLIVNGVEKDLRSILVGGQVLFIHRGLVNVLRLENEWHDDIKDPHAVVNALTNRAPAGVDLLTFWQRPPNTTPLYEYHAEPEAVAALPIINYEHWLRKQITQESRTRVRKASKIGVVVREASFDDSFVDGMVRIFNESAVRQGRHFWHFGKDAATIKRQFSRFLHKEQLIGAYYKNELIGFAFLGVSENFANLGQIISFIKDREKAPNNALIGKAVEFCAAAKIPYLTYVNWPNAEGLATFKRRNGFQRMEIPRYYVPLSVKGRLALRCGLHRDWKEALPQQWRARLKSVKARFSEILARAQP